MGNPQGLPLHWVDSCRGWVSQPVGRGDLAPTIGHLSVNYGHNSYKCQHALVKQIFREVGEIGREHRSAFPTIRASSLSKTLFPLLGSPVNAQFRPANAKGAVLLTPMRCQIRPILQPNRCRETEHEAIQLFHTGIYILRSLARGSGVV